MDEERKLRGTSDDAPVLSDADSISEAHEESYVPPRYTFTAETEDPSVRDKYGMVYDGINQLSADIRRDVDIFSSVEDMIRRGSGEISLKRQMMRKTLDATWIKVIEDCIIPLDNVIRKPRRFIEENEAVLPIELSRNITSRSMRHLAQHTDYISKIEGDTVTPSKILNVFRDETVQTYENRFVNTLINRLYIFVSRRYDAIRENGRASATSVLSYETNFETSSVKGKIQLNMEISASSEVEGARTNSHEEAELWERLEHLKQVVSAYATSPFVQMMGKSYVRPPIMHTNAINKNRDLRQCVALWEFIESYEGAGYELSVKDTAEKMDDRYLDEMLSSLAVQYCVFRYNMSADLSDEMILSETEDGEPFVPKFLDTLEEYESDDFNVHDTSYRKYMSVNGLNPKRKLTVGEWRIRRAIDVALKADRILELKRIADEAERKRREEEEEARLKMEQEEAARLEREAEEARERAQKEAEAEAIEEMQSRSEEEEALRRAAEEAAENAETEAEREKAIEETEEERYARQLEEEKKRAEEVDRRREEAESGLTESVPTVLSASEIVERRNEDEEQERREELRDAREAMEREKREAEEAAAREAYLAEQARGEGFAEETDLAESELTEAELEEEALRREREAEEARLREEEERLRLEKEEEDRLAREEAERLARENEEDEAARYIREEEEEALRLKQEEEEREAELEAARLRREAEEEIRKEQTEREQLAASENAPEEPLDEPPAETVAETVEEPTEETVEEAAEETVEEPVAEASEEPTEEPIEETTEETTEETVEEAAEEIAEPEAEAPVAEPEEEPEEALAEAEEKPVSEEPAEEPPAPAAPAQVGAQKPAQTPAPVRTARETVSTHNRKKSAYRNPTGKKKTTMRPGAKKTGQRKAPKPGEEYVSPRKKNRKK